MRVTLLPLPCPVLKDGYKCIADMVSDLYIDWGAFSCLDYHILFSPGQTLGFISQHGRIPSLWSTKYVHSFPRSCELLGACSLLGSTYVTYLFLNSCVYWKFTFLLGFLILAG